MPQGFSDRTVLMAVTTKIYANTLAKQNEGRLLSQEKLRRLAEADADNLGKMLVDYGYGSQLHATADFDADALIEAEINRLINFVESDCFDENTAAVLLMRFAYNNVKARYKFKLGVTPRTDALYPLLNDVSECAEKGDYSACSDILADALKKLDEANLQKPLSAARIDAVLTEAMYAEMRAKAKKCGKAVKKYVTAKIDFANLTAALRAMRLKVPAADLEAMFLNGGSIDFEVLNEAAKDGWENFASHFAETEYYDILMRVSNGGFAALPAFESDAGAIESSFFDGDIENLLSEAPTLHYYAAALNEYKTVGTIVTCIRNGAREEINKRVRWSF